MSNKRILKLSMDTKKQNRQITKYAQFVKKKVAQMLISVTEGRKLVPLAIKGILYYLRILRY